VVLSQIYSELSAHNFIKVRSDLTFYRTLSSGLLFSRTQCNSRNFKKVIGLRLGLGLVSTDSKVQICAHVQILRMLFFMSFHVFFMQRSEYVVHTHMCVCLCHQAV